MWVVYYSTHVILPTPDHPICFYSSQTRDDLKHLIAHAFKSSNHSLNLSIYSLDDPDIISILTRKASQSVPVSILYDTKATKLPKTLCSQIINRPFTRSSLMHRKLFVLDNSLVFIGSANLTTTSLTMHDNFIIGLYHPALAKQLTTDTSKSTFQLPSQEGQIWLLPEEASCSLEETLALMKSAKEEIRLVMFTLTHPRLIDALIKAHERGVRVECLLDHYTAEGASKTSFDTLTSHGVPVYLSLGQQLLHHKWALFDGKTLLTGSANWTRAAFSKNQECLLKLTPLTPEQNAFMDTLWRRQKAASRHFLLNEV